VVKPYVQVSALSHPIQLAAVFRYLVTGCSELAVAHDYRVRIESSMLAKILNRFIPLLQKLLCQATISIQMSRQQMQISSKNFWEKYKLPKVVACLVGTHIGIKKPAKDCSDFLNKKGYYSLNVMLVSTMCTSVISDI